MHLAYRGSTILKTLWFSGKFRLNNVCGLSKPDAYSSPVSCLKFASSMYGGQCLKKSSADSVPFRLLREYSLQS